MSLEADVRDDDLCCMKRSVLAFGMSLGMSLSTALLRVNVEVREYIA